MKPNELFNYIRNVEYHTLGADLQYKIDVDDNEKVIRVMFQESSSKLDWFLNFLIPIVPAIINKKPYWFSRGWRLSWNSGRYIIMEHLRLFIRSYCPEYRVEVCGYSFGGAIAQICGIEIYEKFGIKSDLITFGSPSPLFGIITKLMAKRCFNSVQQYAHRNDIVTYCPPIPFYFSVKSKRLGKFSFKGLFNPITYHQIYNDEKLY